MEHNNYFKIQTVEELGGGVRKVTSEPFFFDGESYLDTSRAYVTAGKRMMEMASRRPSISVWNYPKINGAWGLVAKIGTTPYASSH